MNQMTKMTTFDRSRQDLSNGTYDSIFKQLYAILEFSFFDNPTPHNYLLSALK